MKLAIPIFLVLGLAVLAFAADAPLSDDQFTAQFRCPESYPTDEARDKAVSAFLAWVKAQHGNWTMDQVIAFRVQLLEQHDCKKSLQAVWANTQGKK